MEIAIAGMLGVVVLAGAAIAAIAWFARRALDAEDHRRLAEVAQAQLAADLRVSDANVESFRRQVQRYEVINRSLREVNDAIRAQPVLEDPSAHGLDRLLATLDAVAAIGPVPDGRAGDGGGPAGLSGGPRPAAGAAADGEGPATVPET